MKQSKYKLENGNYKCECGKEFYKYQSLNAHFSHCLIHTNALGKNIARVSHKGSMHWENKSKEEQQQIHKKSEETLKRKLADGIIMPGFLNKKHTEEFKNKLRELRTAALKGENGHMNYSLKACQYIDKLNKERNWNLQHALNGGELTCLGYWLDGYDKERNIVFEYDEPKHYIDCENNILREYDIKRQVAIIDKLHCKFYRYNEQIDLLYEVSQ